MLIKSLRLFKSCFLFRLALQADLFLVSCGFLWAQLAKKNIQNQLSTPEEQLLYSPTFKNMPQIEGRSTKESSYHTQYTGS